MNESKVEHLFREKVFVPYAAISNSWNIGEIETSDGITCKIKNREFVHVLSDRGTEIIETVYDMHPYKFLSMWYKRFPFMSEMMFLYLELEKI